MSNIHARSARSAGIGFLTLAAATILTAGLADDAAARQRVHNAHFRGLNARAQYVRSVPAQVNAGPTAMRYCGGPKSPMWRGPVEN
jgi:hypothetical protein